MGTTLHIRDARDEDSAALQEVTLAAYQEYAAVMPPAAWEGYCQNMIAAVSATEGVERIVAEEEGAIVGSVLLYPSVIPMAVASGMTPEEVSELIPEDWPEVRLLAVLPERRGQGIGGALMRECLQRARRNGATMLGLHTTDMMQVAMQMYERMGFQRVPETDFHPAPGAVVKGYRRRLDDVE